jgi:hypothetical protein
MLSHAASGGRCRLRGGGFPKRIRRIFNLERTPAPRMSTSWT